QINCAVSAIKRRKTAAISATKIDRKRLRGYLPPPAPKFVIRLEARGIAASTRLRDQKAASRGNA
ncbi:hypothetical protein ACCT30_50460, partial [Rhizobium ruizarguesonis]